MNEERLGTIEQIEEFLSGSAAIEFTVVGDDSERYGHVSRVLQRFDYPQRSKRERGILHRYLQHTSGYSRAQVTRLVARWPSNRLAEVPLIKHYGRPAIPFARKYTPTDIALFPPSAFSDHTCMRFSRTRLSDVRHSEAWAERGAALDLGAAVFVFAFDRLRRRSENGNGKDNLQRLA